MGNNYLRAGIGGILFGVGICILGDYRSADEANVWNNLITGIGGGVTVLGMYGIINSIMKPLIKKAGDLERKINPEVNE